MLYEYGDVLTLQEAAELLQLSPQTVKKLMRSNKLEYFRIGGRYRVTKEAIQEFISSMTSQEK